MQCVLQWSLLCVAVHPKHCVKLPCTRSGSMLCVQVRLTHCMNASFSQLFHFQNIGHHKQSACYYTMTKYISKAFQQSIDHVCIHAVQLTMYIAIYVHTCKQRALWYNCNMQICIKLFQLLCSPHSQHSAADHTAPAPTT